MINYKWIFEAFECKVNEEGLENVITTVHWRYVGTNEDGVSADVYGSQDLNPPNTETFTPYASIDENKVIEWIESAVNVEELKNSINLQIDAIANPAKVTLQAPWDITP